MAIFGMVSTAASQSYTPHAVRSFFAHTPSEHISRFYLIDNDGSLSPADYENYPNLTYVKNSAPRSFAENANFALEHSVGEGADLYFLNNDLIFTPKWIDPLLSKTPEILSPLSNREVSYIKDRLRCEPTMNLESYLGLDRELEQIALHHQSRAQGYRKVLSLPFFCIKLPFAVASVVGLFDESFGRGGAEDNDYCLRAYECGFDVKYANSSYVLHFSGKSTWNGAETTTQTRERDQKYLQRFIEKWGSPLEKLVIEFDQTPLRAAPELAAAAKNGDFRTIIAALKAAPTPL